MMKLQKVKFYPINKRETIDDNIPDEIPEEKYWIDGYLLYWGQGTSLYFHNLAGSLVPVVQNFILGIVKDRNGYIYECYPTNIRTIDD